MLLSLSRLVTLPGNFPTCSHVRSRFISLSSAVTTKGEVYPPNSSLKIDAVHNRNPRNLEKLRIAAKPTGWWLDKPGRCFWNKVTLELSSKNVTSKVVHFHGYVPVVASTREWCIQKYLYSTRDAAAVEAVGQIFAQRCIESGILELYCGFTEEDKKKPKVGIFLSTLTDAGLLLAEPDELLRSDFLHFPYAMDRPWEMVEDPETGEIRQETPNATECNTFKSMTKKPFH